MSVHKGVLVAAVTVLNAQGLSLHVHFCGDFQPWLEEHRFNEKLVFSDEAGFHVW
jgi:hypothetical protein